MGYDMQWQKDDSEEGYFRSNFWSMPVLRAAMDRAGVLEFSASHPEWPEVRELPGETDEAYEARVLEAHRPVVTCSSLVAGKVPLFKFGSMDGWVVSAQECRWIADGLDTLLARPVVGDPDDVAFVREFAAYCRRCADANTGFEVW